MNGRNKKGLTDLLHEFIFSGVDFVSSLISKGTNRSFIKSEPDIIDMPQPPALYKQNPWVKIAGIMMAITGFTCGGGILLWALLILLGTAMAGEIGFGIGLFGIFLLMIGGCMFLGLKGVSMIRSINRFSVYVRTIGQEELCNIKQLADRVGKSTKYVIKDVERMIRKGWFCQGHLDEKKTCLMVTDDMYREYQRLEREKKRIQVEEKMAQFERSRKNEANRKGEPIQRKDPLSKLPADVRRVIEQGNAHVKQIRKCNDAIPGESISAKIDHMEELLKRIFNRVEQKPEYVGDIRKLMEYYLPTTIKLLETYTDMDAQPIGGENIESTKMEIEDSLDMINRAFEKLLDSLFQDAAWDVSSDISVLKTMLAQEGLGEDGFNSKQS